MNVNESDSSISIELAIDTAKHFGISKDDAAHMAAEITTTVKENWRDLAVHYGLTRGQIEEMKPAFIV